MKGALTSTAPHIAASCSHPLFASAGYQDSSLIQSDNAVAELEMWLRSVYVLRVRPLVHQLVDSLPSQNSPSTSRVDSRCPFCVC